jgi:hypothetical protein
VEARRRGREEVAARPVAAAKRVMAGERRATAVERGSGFRWKMVVRRRVRSFCFGEKSSGARLLV